MGTLIVPGPLFPVEIPCETGQVSDGYHTFDELYDHRCLLFCALSRYDEGDTYCWKSGKHHDGSSYEGWFIAGIELKSATGSKTITYHLPVKYWDLFNGQDKETAPEWDGHTSADVLQRLANWLKV
jgi:hypothetical protein